MRMKIKVFIYATVVAFALAGCAQQEARTGYPVTIGTTVFESPAHRVVSLSPAISEQMVMLGYGGRLVATVENNSMLSGVVEVTTCGSFFAPDVDVILEQDPDLVLTAQPIPQYLSDALTAAQIPVYEIEPSNDEGQMIDNLSTLCMIFEGTERGLIKKNEILFFQEALSQAAMEQSADALGALGHNSPPTALWVIDYPNVAVTGDAPENRMLEEMGFYNMLVNQADYTTTKEELSSLSPDYLFCPEGMEEEIANYFKKSKAVTEQQIYAVDMTAFDSASPRLFLERFRLVQEVFGEELIQMPNVTMEQPPYVLPEKGFFEKLFG